MKKIFKIIAITALGIVNGYFVAKLLYDSIFQKGYEDGYAECLDKYYPYRLYFLKNNEIPDEIYEDCWDE